MRKHGRHKGHGVTEREMSSYTFRSTTPIDDTLNMEITQSETDLTWRYKSPWNDLLLWGHKILTLFLHQTCTHCETYPSHIHNNYLEAIVVSRTQ